MAAFTRESFSLRPAATTTTLRGLRLAETRLLLDSLTTTFEPDDDCEIVTDVFSLAAWAGAANKSAAATNGSAIVRRLMENQNNERVDD